MQVRVAYISNETHMVGKHAFPLTEFVGLSAHVTYTVKPVLSKRSRDNPKSLA